MRSLITSGTCFPWLDVVFIVPKLIGMFYCIEALSIAIGERRGPRVCWALEAVPMPVRCRKDIQIEEPSLIERAINTKVFRSPNHAQGVWDSRDVGELAIVS